MRRLEEIKKHLVLLQNAIDVDDETKNYVFEDLKVEWLIERVQELESLNNAFDDLDSDYIDLQQQNKRYRELIENVELTAQIKGYDDVYNFLVKALEREG